MQIKNQDLIVGGAYRMYVELIEKLFDANLTIFHISPKIFKNIIHTNFYHYDIQNFLSRYNYISLRNMNKRLLLSISKKNEIFDYQLDTSFEEGIKK